MLQTDRTFTRNYFGALKDYSSQISNVHLTGLGDRSYFDARAMYFQIQTDLPHVPGEPLNPANPFDTNWNNQYDQERQAVVAPVIDYDHIFGDPVFGGEVAINSNVTALNRGEEDPFAVDLNGDGKFTPNEKFYHGVAGSFVRASTEVSWQRQFIGPFGQLITPFASLRGDAFGLDPEDPAPAALTPDASAFRGMPSVGVEWSWPVMAVMGSVDASFRTDGPADRAAGRDAWQANCRTKTRRVSSSTIRTCSAATSSRAMTGSRAGRVSMRACTISARSATASRSTGCSASPISSPARIRSPQRDIADAGNFSGLETDISDYVGRLVARYGPRTAVFGARPLRPERFHGPALGGRRNRRDRSGHRVGVISVPARTIPTPAY